MKFSNDNSNERFKENLIGELLEKSKNEILDGKTSNFDNILQKSKNRYKIV
ncbi:hypothetical protein [Polaribacter sp. Hel_I_88]|uniref:hypothetical protein n=1 Tax=Polaribacter sp. Hel_I_88 TaxID=1250006 RepID=UPI000B0C5712|nr:hypothetical protein [Polaribacter sp. Hel_I_88]